MAQKKRKKQPIERTPWFDDLSAHTKQAIAAVIFCVLGIFFILASLGVAGVAGEYTHKFLRYLFGYGFALAPLVCALYVYVMLKPKDNETVSTSKVIGVLLLFVAVLGLFELTAEEAGGLTGFIVLWPFVTMLGGITSGIVLSAGALIAIFLTFNTGFIRAKKPVDAMPEINPTVTVGGVPTPLIDGEGDVTAEEGPENSADGADDSESKKKSMGERLGLSKQEPSFIVSSFVGSYDPPPLTLLNRDKGKAKTGDVKANANIIKRTLLEFGINVEMDTVEIGPSITRYSLKPAQGVKISRIVGLQRELELNLASGTIRIEAPIPGKSLVGIEVPNLTKAQVGLASLLTSPEYTDSDKPLLIALGKDITGKSHFANIARMPHGLIAGTTGSGKSVTIHNIVLSLLYRNSPEQLRLIMVDPKRVELTLYDGIPHLLTPVITQPKKALLSLKWAVTEMERRYDILQAEKMQNLSGYHEKVYRPAKDEWVKNGSKDDEKMSLPEALPYIVVIMDELADLMHSYPRELEALIVRLAQMSRAVGIHLILATQRPSVNVITGTIKANIPTRLAMQVASQIDSRTILDQVGAEKLLGQGDMLYMTGELSKPIRLQSAYVSNDELKRVIVYLKSLDHVQELESIDLDSKEAEVGSNAMFGSLVGDDGDDDLYEDAKQAVLEAGKASTSYLQRKLRIGYSRAARLMDLLEERGVIGAADGSKPREIIAEKSDGLPEEEPL